jgi:dienelactone hydrolase
MRAALCAPGMLAALTVLTALTARATAAEPQAVEVASLDRHGDAPLMLRGFWFARGGEPRRAPALVLLHGCGGPYDRRGRLSQRLQDYAALLNREGWHVLVVDSLSARGETELCTQRIGDRAVTMTQRRRDALGALQWLAARPEVDGARLGLIGWSNGGSTVLAALQRGHREVEAAAVRPAFGVAFYPGCVDPLQRGWQPIAPLLMLLGADDDWTPAAPCEALAVRVGTAVQHETYAGAYHGFDGDGPVRLRREVPNGVYPGQGVHVGGDPAARDASRERLLRWLRERAAPR